MDWGILRQYAPDILSGTARSLMLTAWTLALGMLLAVPLAACRNARHRSLRWAAAIYVFVFRGTPLLVLLYLIYYGAPDIPALRHGPLWTVLREPLPCAILALSLNSAGYLTEILAGAARAVPRAEIEAGTAAGVNRLDVFRHVVAPNVARIALRTYGNEVVFVLKGTSVASLVTITELMATANHIYFNTFDAFTPFITAGVIYFTIVSVLLGGIKVAERRLSPERRRSAPRGPQECLNAR